MSLGFMGKITMATDKSIEVQMEEARLLADLMGIYSDLHATINFSKHLLETSKIAILDTGLHEALSIAILIKYSRSFVTGIRRPLKINDIPGLSPEELRRHEDFIALRNKYIAHSVNEFEENKVVAYYNPEKVNDEGINRISVQRHTLISLTDEEAEAIINLSQKIKYYVYAIIQKEQDRILDLVRNQPIIELLKTGQSAFKPNMKNVNKKRKQ